MTFSNVCNCITLIVVSATLIIQIIRRDKHE